MGRCPLGKFSNFSGSTLRRSRMFEEEDPTSGLSNLADCMLVLACGLMVALVVAWNVDLWYYSQAMEKPVEKRDGWIHLRSAKDAASALVPASLFEVNSKPKKGSK